MASRTRFRRQKGRSVLANKAWALNVDSLPSAGSDNGEIFLDERSKPSRSRKVFDFDGRLILNEAEFLL